ncbi:MAG: putative transposase [Alteromonadaceae bacterium]|jgi:putative transposase
MVKRPEDYKWSSYLVNTGGSTRKNLVMHETYRQLGKNEQSRIASYQALIKIGLKEKVIKNIQRAARFSMPFASKRFKKQIEQAISRKIGFAKRGRPTKDQQK